jgi:hypothetical protein
MFVAVLIKDKVLTAQQDRTVGAQDHIGVIWGVAHDATPQEASTVPATRSSRSRQLNAPR